MSNQDSEIAVVINQTERFNAAIHGPFVLQDYGDLQILTKDKATETGRAIAALTFTVDVRGQKRKAQTVVSVRTLMMLLSLISAHYDADGMPIT